jgi:site-specific recombinase XerC
MKAKDERDLKALLEIVSVGEALSARQALDRLVEYRINQNKSTNYIPHVNRLSMTMKISGHFRREGATIGGSGGRSLWVRTI